jgi:hypothetical protein
LKKCVDNTFYVVLELGKVLHTNQRLALEPVKQLGHKCYLVYLELSRTVKKILEIEVERTSSDEFIAKLLDKIQIVNALFKANVFMECDIYQKNDCYLVKWL